MAIALLPQNLFHEGTASPLALSTAMSVPPSGDINIIVEGDASQHGWQPIPNGQKQVVTVGRGTQYESKYLVSSIDSGTVTSTLHVLEADRDYDGTQPTLAPAGTLVEHTISATEMSTINNHMRTKQTHGASGELADTESAQTLKNKTLIDPVLSMSNARTVPVGAIMMWSAATVPAGWLTCDGSAFSAVTYPALAAVLGGNTLPNLVDSYVKGGSAPVLSPTGANSKTITIENLPAHNHGGGGSVTSGGQSAGHTHAFSGTAGSAGSHGHGAVAWTDWQGEHSHNIKSNGGTSQGPNNTSYYETNDGYYVGGVIEAAGAHGHNVEVSVAADGAHTHAVSGSTGAVSGGHTHTVTFTIPSQGGGSPFVNEPKHVVLRYIICAAAQAV